MARKIIFSLNCLVGSLYYMRNANLLMICFKNSRCKLAFRSRSTQDRGIYVQSYIISSVDAGPRIEGESKLQVCRVPSQLPLCLSNTKGLFFLLWHGWCLLMTPCFKSPLTSPSHLRCGWRRPVLPLHALQRGNEALLPGGYLDTNEELSVCLAQIWMRHIHGATENTQVSLLKNQVIQAVGGLSILNQESKGEKLFLMYKVLPLFIDKEKKSTRKRPNTLQ